MKTKKKAFLLAISAILVVIATAFGTLAYLTSEITITHTFTVGDVEVKVTAENLAAVMYNDETVQEGKERKLIPNHEYNVPVKVELGEESEEAWVFVQVINPFTAIEAEEGTLTLDEETPYRTLANQMADNNWVPLNYNGTAVEGVYYYNDSTEGGIGNTVPAGSTLWVYDFFKVSSEAMGGTSADAIAKLQSELADEGITETVVMTDKEKALYLGDYDDDKITIIVYVVQADGLETVDSAWSVFSGKYEKNSARYLDSEDAN